MGSKHFENRARREWWSLHIEAWRRSGLGIRKYCQQQRLTENTLRRWLKRLAGNETALKLENYRTELRRERARAERERRLESRSSAGSRSPRMCAIERLRRFGRCMSWRRTGADGAPRLRLGDAAVAAFAAQMPRPTGHRGGHDRLARPSSPLRPSAR
ncbi:IS66 family insertion sequence element accessory protein TnpA [Bradyrhizobium sp. SZCCHNS3053]|uniref:IS66 family insertion sequence element accessory protein TnpA n=1 Tax=Bradyrhizobium sp. SZCCHNS3053 TaxID=3057322 RepID=UPI00396725C6